MYDLWALSCPAVACMWMEILWKSVVLFGHSHACSALISICLTFPHMLIHDLSESRRAYVFIYLNAYIPSACHANGNVKQNKDVIS